jgi:dienelactone hydrolase
VNRILSASLFFAYILPPLFAQAPQTQFPAGTAIPKVTCAADPEETYALYLPSSFSSSRKWPIIYLFDPAARGPVAVQVVQAAAEKFGYILAASNNSRNGPRGGAAKAASAMWRDTQQKFPVDERRRYVAGMSGGSRVATSVALSCDGCVAGVIANAAGFPIGTAPSPNMKFAYFAAVGDADFNYPEFIELRKRLEAAGTRYRIRIFEGQHGWAPADTWLEALSWMDIQAMTSGSLPRDEPRITAALNEMLGDARAFESKNDPLSAFREYQSAVRDFSGLADVSVAKARLTDLEKNKALKSAEKREGAEIDEQSRLDSGPMAQMQKIPSGDLTVTELSDLRSNIADLKKQAANPGPKALIVRRALGGLVVQAYEAGEESLEDNNYRSALHFFDLAAAGSAQPGWAHYQKARAYAMTASKKDMLSELRLSSKEGFHEADALDAAEFQPYRADQEFQSLTEEWKKTPAQ